MNPEYGVTAPPMSESQPLMAGAPEVQVDLAGPGSYTGGSMQSLGNPDTFLACTPLLCLPTHLASLLLLYSRHFLIGRGAHC